MWKVLPKYALLKLLLVAFSALLLTVLILVFEHTLDSSPSLTWSNFGQAFEIATPVTIMFLVVVYVTGKWGWMLFWKIPWLSNVLNKSVCPDLNGVWSGHIESSFLDEQGNRSRKDVELKIEANFFGFSIFLKSLDGYQSSKVVQSEIYRDPRTNSFYISYIYEGEVPIPKESDDRLFDGAGKLEVKFDGNSIRLEGTYWTNRAWQRKQNTAGIIKLTKQDT